MLITAGNPKDLYISNVLVLSMLFHYFSEYAASGCLYDHLANNKLNFDQILQWSTEIALGKQKFILIVRGFCVQWKLFSNICIQHRITSVALTNYPIFSFLRVGYVIAQQVAC